MWYILYMNKDVIYVEPEDDITDIILKIENSKEKIVALVPPKKAGVFRSVVNIKLIAKSGASSGKKIVLVTVDPSIIRLAASAKLPVTKNLQTAPSIPVVTEEPETLKGESLVEESDGEVETEEDVEELLGDDEKDDDETDDKKEDDKKAARKEKEDKDSDDDEGDEDNEDAKKPEKPVKKKSEKGGNKLLMWVKDHKKVAIFGGVAALLLVVFLVWAFVFAPAVTVTVGVKATSNNFSEAVSFTTNLTEENASEGKFYIEEKKIEDIKEVEFEATGKKNVGEKATGVVKVRAVTSSKGGTVQIKAGDSFSNSGLTYIADKGVTMSYDGTDDSVCSNVDDKTPKRTFDSEGCWIYANVAVTAAEPGSKYNISARENGWDTTAPVSVTSDGAMSGGTDAEVTIVQQSDIDKAKSELTAANENENKEKLLNSIGDNMLVIDSSFKQTTGEAISTPGAGEEVKDGAKPKLKAVTTASIDVVDRTKIEEFITKKANLGEDKKIYEIKNPFIENFSQSGSGFTGKLKTTYLTGPKVSVNSVVEAIRGKGIGDAQHILKDIDGVADVRIQGSYPWVMSVPGDSNKITVNISVKDQNGGEIKADTGDDENKDEEDTKKEDSKESEDKKDSSEQKE